MQTKLALRTLRDAVVTTDLYSIEVPAKSPRALLAAMCPDMLEGMAMVQSFAT